MPNLNQNVSVYDALSQSYYIKNFKRTDSSIDLFVDTDLYGLTFEEGLGINEVYYSAIIMDISDLYSKLSYGTEWNLHITIDGEEGATLFDTTLVLVAINRYNDNNLADRQGFIKLDFVQKDLFEYYKSPYKGKAFNNSSLSTVIGESLSDYFNINVDSSIDDTLDEIRIYGRNLDFITKLINKFPYYSYLDKYGYFNVKDIDNLSSQEETTYKYITEQYNLNDIKNSGQELSFTYFFEIDDVSPFDLLENVENYRYGGIEYGKTTQSDIESAGVLPSNYLIEFSDKRNTLYKDISRTTFQQRQDVPLIYENNQSAEFNKNEYDRLGKLIWESEYVIKTVSFGISVFDRIKLLYEDPSLDLKQSVNKREGAIEYSGFVYNVKHHFQRTTGNERYFNYYNDTHVVSNNHPI
jgi:hypothetical protein